MKPLSWDPTVRCLTTDTNEFTLPVWRCPNLCKWEVKLPEFEGPVPELWVQYAMKEPRACEVCGAKTVRLMLDRGIKTLEQQQETTT